MHQPKVFLVIMDGWGHSPIKKGNAIANANVKTFNNLWSNYPHLLLNAFGQSVGLPWGSIGSSEVGHTSIGSGKLIRQELALIDREIESGSFYNNAILKQFVSDVKKAGKPVHLIGLVSNGGVHSNISHIYSSLELFKRNGITNNIYVHVITDGRDTAPKSALTYVKELQNQIRRLKINAKIATIVGRYYAMDRDSRWDRTKKSYLAMTKNEGSQENDPIAAIKKQYEAGTSDEFIKPIIIKNKKSNFSISKLFKKNETVEETTKIIDGDFLYFFNIRPDRMRQICEMFLFDKNELGTLAFKKSKILTLTTYNEFFNVDVPYPSEKIKFPLAKLLSNHGVRQGHFAETEKYAHVTYFFNGGNSTPNKNEYWEMVPSPKVATYDMKPEMSAAQITRKVLDFVQKKKLDFVLINYANCDMVGHTGKFEKVVKAAETVDEQLAILLKKFPDSTFLITADHGNAECMIHPETGEIDKMHSVNPVPFIIVSKKYQINSKIKQDNTEASGILADITPTVLELFDIKKTPEMNGVSLLGSVDDK